jgi:hypothetical protein
MPRSIEQRFVVSGSEKAMVLARLHETEDEVRRMSEWLRNGGGKVPTQVADDLVRAINWLGRAQGHMALYEPDERAGRLPWTRQAG